MKKNMNSTELKKFLEENNYTGYIHGKQTVYDTIAEEETTLKDALFSIMTDDVFFA